MAQIVKKALLILIIQTDINDETLSDGLRQLFQIILKNLKFYLL